MQERIRAKFDDPWHVQRFKRLKNDSMDRIGADELTHAAFMAMLLDVWEHQMESNAGDFEPNIIIEQREDRRELSIVRDSGVISDGQNA